MARIRTIKPEFPQSETIGRLSRDARLLFVLLWTVADDSGRLRGNVAYLSGALFPYDDDARGLLEGWLGELSNEGCIRRYEVEGKQYIDIPSFLKHQRIEKPSPSRLPDFSEASPTIPGKVAEASPTDLVSSNGPSTAAPPAPSVKDELAKVLDSEHVEAVIEHRKKKRAPLTAHAARLLAAKFAKWPKPNEAADAMIANGWQGFEVEWMQNRKQNGHAPPLTITSGPPKGFREAKSTGEYVLYMQEKTGDPKLTFGDYRLSKHQFVPADWHPNVTPMRKVSA